VYLAEDTGDSFRWDGTKYARISERVKSTGIEDSSVVGRAVVTAVTEKAARDATYSASRSVNLNVMDYGVKGDGVTDDAPTIRQVATDNPGKALYFPAGNYRCLTGLTFPFGNSLELHPDARIYADAAMSILIDHRPNDKSTDGTPEYFELVTDKSIRGGTLDGNYLAGTILKVSRQSRMRITGITFLNPVTNGLWTARPGAEHFVSDCAFQNMSMANNSATNTAIYNNSLATHFLDIVITDFNRGAFDDDGAMWTRTHVWLGQDRYAQGTVGYETNGNSHFVQCYADTYQTGWKINDTFSQTRIICCVYFAHGYYYTDIVQYPPSAVSIAEGARLTFVENSVYGHTSGGIGNTAAFTGSTAKLTAYGNYFDKNIMADQRADWNQGVKQGTTLFTPFITGSITPGTHTYTIQTGRVVVSGGIVTSRVSVAATLDSTIDGNLEIGGIPALLGTLGLKGGTASVGARSGLGNVVAVTHAGGSQNFKVFGANATSGNTVPISATALRGATVYIDFTVVASIEIDLARAQDIMEDVVEELNSITNLEGESVATTLEGQVTADKPAARERAPRKKTT
jgi:hypothetical protein